jgi:septal ring-binding cell division protein DamX
MMPKVNKNIIFGILIAVVLVFSIIIGWAFFQKGKISSEKEVAPEKEETIEEVLERLTPAEPEPLTEEEKREQEELLKQLTPAQPKPMTEEEQKELEKLLKELTPK